MLAKYRKGSVLQWGKPVWWLFLWCLIPISCIDEIDLEDTGTGAGQMVIQGRVVKGCPSFVTLQVSTSLDFNGRGLPPPISGAQVILHSQGGLELQVPEIEPGLYRLELGEGSEPLEFEIGESYRISVTTSENDHYLSSWESLQAVPQPDSVSIALVERDVLDHNDVRLTQQFVQFFIHTPLLVPNREGKALLRWTFMGIYQITEPCISPPLCNPQTCYVDQNMGLDKAVVLNGNETSSSRVDLFMLDEDDAEGRYGLGFLFKAKQGSLSRDAFRYWNQVNEAVSLSGGLFEAVPGKIIGNMSNESDPSEEVFGYFYATEEVEITRFIKPVEVGSPKPICDGAQNLTETTCTDCASLPFSTKEIPEGWEF